MSAIDEAALVDWLADAGVGPGDLLALVVAERGLAVVPVARADDEEETGAAPAWIATDQAPARAVAAVERAVRPRWAVWSSATAVALAEDGAHLATAWDVAAVHRLLFGGWRAEPARAWARTAGMATHDLPVDRPLDLFTQMDSGDADDPFRPDGHLDAAWAAGAWQDSPVRWGRWAQVLATVVARQVELVDALAAGERPAARRQAHVESTAELLCAELMVEGLPVDRGAAEAAIATFVGPRPRTEAEAVAARQERDLLVLRHAPAGMRFDLRSPGQVRSLLRSVGIEVPDTRAWTLEPLRGTHPVVDDLLAWRKAERVATTFGYAWLDEHLGDDGRFRGEWSGSDGAAGRMTATAGLHNMPADLRSGVVAEAGHLFVRADLGQIEPRVLAAVSGDAALARATQADDLYAPVAEQLGVDRPTAKVAVLGAMYGQTTGLGAQALRGLQRAYPVAMALLDDADRTAQVGTDLRTYGGRLLRMGGPGVVGAEAASGEASARARAAARGRYGRNAMVQGAAAELFKVWAAVVRARGRDLQARIVLCLHDELLVHVPTDQATAAAALVDDALQEAAARWAPDRSVRFLAETSIVRSWADAKLSP